MAARGTRIAVARKVGRVILDIISVRVVGRMILVWQARIDFHGCRRASLSEREAEFSRSQSF